MCPGRDSPGASQRSSTFGEDEQTAHFRFGTDVSGLQRRSVDRSDRDTLDSIQKNDTNGRAEALAHYRSRHDMSPLRLDVTATPEAIAAAQRDSVYRCLPGRERPRNRPTTDSLSNRLVQDQRAGVASKLCRANREVFAPEWCPVCITSTRRAPARRTIETSAFARMHDGKHDAQPDGQSAWRRSSES